MKKTLFLLFILSGLSELLIAQDFPYAKTSPQEMDMTKYSKDTSANAVVLQEYGKSQIIIGNDDDLKLIFEYHVKIKIFNSKGFDNGTVVIKLRNDEKNNSREELSDVNGITTYKDEDGLTQQAEFDPTNSIYYNHTIISMKVHRNSLCPDCATAVLLNINTR